MASSESIKQRFGGSKLDNLSKKEIKKLFDRVLADLNNIANDVVKVQTVTNNLAADMNNMNTVVSTNLISAVGNLKVTVNNLVSDVQKISNNTNSANNTVQVTATLVTTNLNTATTNVNAQSLSITGTSSLTLTS